MTPDERLTAYALDDPGLTPADRKEVEAALQTDPAARKAFMETRELARLLTAGLAAEQAALPAEPPVTVPSEAAKPPTPKSHGWKVNAVAAVVLLAVFGGLYAALNPQRVREASGFSDVGSNVQFTSGTATTAAPTAVKTTAPRPEYAAGGMDRKKMQGGASSTRPADDRLADGGATVNESRERFAADPNKGDVGAGKGEEKRPTAPGRPAPTGALETQYGGPPGMPAAPGGPVPPAAATRPADESGVAGLAGDGATEKYKLMTGTPAQPPGEGLPGGYPSPNDRYPALAENRFIPVEGRAALSTFGVDVDTASYAIVRKYLSMGQLPPANAVRLEELVNYFPYQDKAPDGDDPFAVTVELAECPWQPKHRLARIGLKAKPVATDKRPPSNLVFLVDVSGSMNEPNKLPLVKASLKLLVGQLGENDRVAMVVYAGTTGLVLDSTSAMKKDVILAALDRLEAGGSTNGSGGIQQAYAVAAANFIKGGTNRVILCTDGDWNVGTTSTDALVRMIEEKRGTGVFLSVFGFGMGNLRDEMMVQLAGKGNGNYGYIDTLKEANKALVEQLGGTLVTVAKDVKIQVEFNPAAVRAYRLLGYEKRALAAKDFSDDKKDAGEMGAGHVVTALYELVPAGGAAPGEGAGDGLRYQPNPDPKPAAKAGKANESFVVKMRHKKPDGDTSTLREQPVTDPGKGYGNASEDFRFAAAVASFAMLLRESPHKGNATFAAVQELAGAARSHDPGGYRAEFLELVRQAKATSGKP